MEELNVFFIVTIWLGIAITLSGFSIYINNKTIKPRQSQIVSKLAGSLVLPDLIKSEISLTGRHRKYTRLIFNYCKIIVTNDAVILLGLKIGIFKIKRYTKSVIITRNTNLYASLFPSEQVVTPSKVNKKSYKDAFYIHAVLKDKLIDTSLDIRLLGLNDDISLKMADILD